MFVAVIVPEPEPVLATLRLKPGSVLTTKVAVTLCAWFIVTVQAPAPEQAPLQPVKVLPTPAVALSTTPVPVE